MNEFQSARYENADIDSEDLDWGDSAPSRRPGMQRRKSGLC